MSREIDALIAEHVMGWQSLGDCWATGSTHKDRQMKKQHFNPSECISDAWIVVEKMQKKSIFSMMKIEWDECYGIDDRTGWTVSMGGIVQVELHPSAPEAICLAALSALGVSYE